MQPEPTFIIFASNILIILASESLYNFASNLTLTCFTLQFFWVGEMTFNEDDCILIINLYLLKE